MKAPGTAYDDPVLGKDPQPAHMSEYVDTATDNGGVHINSGIPNHAFYLAAIALGGHAWEKAGLIWYTTLCDSRLSANAQFQDFANLTADNAGRLFGDVEQQAVINAWQQVGIIVTATAVKISGNWTLHYSWGPTASYAQVALQFKNDGTFSGGAVGQVVAAGRNGAAQLQHRPGEVRGHGRREHRLGRDVDVQRPRRGVVPLEGRDGRPDVAARSRCARHDRRCRHQDRQAAGRELPRSRSRRSSQGRRPERAHTAGGTALSPAACSTRRPRCASRSNGTEGSRTSPA